MQSPAAVTHAPAYEQPLATPIPWRAIWPWALFGLVLLFALYIVGVDEGAASLLPGRWLHEFVHDGRHLLSFPCH